MSERKKIVRSTQAQIKALVDYMFVNQSFANGDFGGPLGSKRLQDEWELLRGMLMEYGPDKTVEQWKQTWKDLKKKARHENAAAALTLSTTGNYVPVPPVSEITKKVLDIIGQECSTGAGPDDSSSSSQAVIVTFENTWPMASTQEEEVMTVNVESENVPPPTQASAEATASRPRQRTGSSCPTTQNRAVPDLATLQDENNHLLKNLCDLMAVHNALQKDRNSILRERNRILRRK